MSMRSIGSILRRGWWILACGLLLGLLAGMAMAKTTAKQYTAQCQVLLSVGGKNSLTDLNQGATYVERSIATFAQAATSPYVLDPVAQRLHLNVSGDSLTGDVSTNVPTDQDIIEITAVQPTAQGAADLANAVAEQSVSAISKLSPGRDTGGTAVTGTIIQQATAPGVPSAPSTKRDLGLGAIAGLVIASLALIVRDALDRRILSGAKLRRLTSVPVLSDMRPGAALHLPLIDAKNVNEAAIRQLHASLLARRPIGQERPYVLTLTSASDSHEAMRWAAPLAQSLSASGIPTTLVTSTASDYVEALTNQGVTVTTVDATNIVSLLDKRFPQRINEIAQTSDVVIIDAGQLGSSTLAARAVHLATDSILVVELPATTEDELKRALGLMDQQDASLLGLVVTAPAGAAKDLRVGSDMPDRAVLRRVGQR